MLWIHLYCKVFTLNHPGLYYSVSELVKFVRFSVSGCGRNVSELRSVPRVFRAFSEAAPDVPAETAASVRLFTAWHRSQLLYRWIKENKPSHTVSYMIFRKKHSSNNEPGSDVWTPGIGRDISTELARPLWGLRFDVLNLGACFWISLAANFTESYYCVLPRFWILP